MAYNVATYSNRKTALHSIAASCKILLLLAFSICLFLIESWAALLCYAILFGIAAYAARLHFALALKQLAPLFFVLLVSVLVNSFAFSPSALASAKALIQDTLFASYVPICLFGNLYFQPAGCEFACFNAFRIVLLVWASLLLTTTTTSKEITDALSGFLKPFAHFGLPVRDIATIVSLALRFIPETIDGFHRVKAAQLSRGAHFESGSLFERLKAWCAVLMPAFVGLFRRADRLALAMDARCYGMCQPNLTGKKKTSMQSYALLVFGVLALIAVVVLL